MSDERDDAERIRELRELYGRLTPPPLADELDGADAETARAVRWMQAAWRGLEVPAGVPPVRRAPRARLPRVLPWLAAAAVLAGGVTLWLRTGRPRRAPAENQAVRADSVEIEDVRADRLELRSGPVRLVLLSPPRHTEAPTAPAEAGG